MKDFLARINRSKPKRVWDHYNNARGNVLAGGIAYASLFSMFPALAVAFTSFAIVLGQNSGLQEQFVEYLNDAFGTTVIGLREGEGLVQMSALVQAETVSVVGLVSLITLLFTGLGWIDSMRQGLRAVFGLDRLASPIYKKLNDVLALVVLGLLVLSSVVVSLVVSSASDYVLSLIGLNTSAAQFGVRLLVLAAVLLVDTGVFLVFFRVVAKVPIPVRQMLSGAVIGAVGLDILKWGSGYLMSKASDNAFLASAAIVIGLLLWFNLIGRITLLAGSWANITIRDGGTDPLVVERIRQMKDAERDPEQIRADLAESNPTSHAGVRPLPLNGQRSVTSTLDQRHAVQQFTPDNPQRAEDRVTLAAGAVLGASAVAGLGLAGRLIRNLARLGR